MTLIFILTVSPAARIRPACFGGGQILLKIKKKSRFLAVSVSFVKKNIEIPCGRFNFIKLITMKENIRL
jgi:hypothetical protein